PYVKEFKDCCNSEIIPAFRWENGKIFGIGGDVERSKNYEFIYIHLQKRAMKFTPGLENEDSFLIVPNEFIRDHELSDEEITAFTTPNAEYEKILCTKYNSFYPNTKGLRRLKDFLKNDTGYKIIMFKKLINKLLRRKLASPYV
ncbi:MAG: hypothetical protein IJS99_04870, partial [Synergistaceae bacterium]|nr:hypothetical protein [Synergistaceae bacterium]